MRRGVMGHRLHGNGSSRGPVGRLLAAAVLMVLLGGCSEEPDAAAQFEPVVDAKQMMNWIMDPSADVIWGSAGTITTFEGVEDLAPTTQEGWDAVRNAAATLAETGNLLKIPGHSRGADWDEIATGLTRTSVLLIQAAENKNDQQVFDYGGQL
ncbi:MAG TPA: hypothetical protein VIS76_10330, partial [Pseudomonadales bacterium]